MTTRQPHVHAKKSASKKRPKLKPVPPLETVQEPPIERIADPEVREELRTWWERLRDALWGD